MIDQLCKYSKERPIVGVQSGGHKSNALEFKSELLNLNMVKQNPQKRNFMI